MTKNRLGDRLLRSLCEFVEARRHQLHADPNVGFCDETAQALNDVGTVVRLQDHIQVHRDSFGFLVVARSTHLLQMESDKKFC